MTTLGDRPGPVGRFVRSLEERRWDAAREREWEAAYRDRAFRSPSTTLSAPPHLLVVPHFGPGHPEWAPGTRNLYFEAMETARERFPGLRVSVLGFTGDEPARDWHERLVDTVRAEAVTHVIGHAEIDPGRDASDPRWTWDQAWRLLARETDAVLLGVLFDSAFRWITAGSRRLARESDRYLLVDICMPMDGVLVRGRSEAGPVNMPMSSSLLSAIDARVAGLPKAHDVSFIGALYPHRVELIERLRARGLRVAVNPHRSDETTDFASSRSNQPSYLDYMAGLAQSELTINFSRSSAGPFEQLKTRVIEASVVGCLVLTDDRDRTGRFWVEGEEFDRFDAVDELPALVERWLADPAALAIAQGKARARARSLAARSFWGGIEAALERRRLRPLRAAGPDGTAP